MPMPMPMPMPALCAGLCTATTTLGQRELALQLAQQAVQRGLAACAQVDEAPITSIYVWQGQLEQTREWRLSFKTTQAQEPALRQWLHQSHPYQTPQWLVWPASASQDYAHWVGANLSRAPEAPR